MPRASVVIPAYHSQRSLPRCLDALRAQSFRDFEVIVVNSSPEEETRLLVAAYPEVRFEQSPTRLLPHAARNRGVELARGELLVFTDPDCCARPDWLARLVAACDAGDGPVGGSILLERGGWLARGIHRSKFPYQLAAGAPGPAAVLPTANACYSRAQWRRVGPFDGELYCGDSLLSQRAAAAGLPPRFVPEAVVTHEEHGSLRGFLRERFTRGRELARVRRRAAGWSRPRAALHAAAAPARVAVALARVMRSAARGHELGGFVATLPLVVAGQVAWTLGESRAFLLEA
jgi:GT2 family glycosyltransferase